MSEPSDARVRSFNSRHVDHTGLARFFRQLHPFDTAGLVAADLGVSRSTARNWLEGRNRLSLPHLLLLMAVYGPDVLKALWPGSAPGWLDSAVQAEMIERREAQLAKLQTDLAALKARKVGG